MKRALAFLVAMAFLSVAATAAPPKKTYPSRTVSKRSSKRSSKRASAKGGRYSKKGGFAKNRTIKGKASKPVKRAHR